MKKISYIITLLFLFLGVGAQILASQGNVQEAGNSIATTLFWVAILLIIARLSSLVEKVGQPSVLGELVVGIIIGNLFLIGISFFEPIKSNEFITFLSELGVILLLFQVGLESNISQMRKVGFRAFLVAIVGVVLPFVLGTYIVGPWLLPGLSLNAYLFLGAALTATSVGITARVFKDLDKLKTKEAQIVLGAAVIDDVLGLIILAIVSAIATIGAISFGIVSVIFLKSIGFLVGAILLGQLLAKILGSALSKINTGFGMKFTLAISFALIFSYISELVGLAPIVGAFAAGLILDPVHFKFFNKPKVSEDLLASSEKLLDEKHKNELKHIAEHYSEKHVEELIEPLAYFFVPIFFVVTGMSVQLETLFDVKILFVSLAITFVAIVGKYVAGLFAGNVNKNIVGFGMVPRGEVGLIFASIGSSLGVISSEVFSIIVIMVILTTLLTPPVLNHLLKKSNLQPA